MNDPGTWQAFYNSELQSLWLLLIAPALFLAWRVVAPAHGPGVAKDRAGFVNAWCVGFGVATLLDPLMTGPFVRALGWDGIGATAVMLLFVLLGDFRIWWLVFHCARPGRDAILRALVPTVAIAVFGYAAFALLGAMFDAVHGQVLWLLHETTFCATALVLRARWLPKMVDDPAVRRFLSECLLYAAGYYALWATADVIILAGSDLGWALRVIPNQLYYAFTIPFVWWRYFASR